MITILLPAATAVAIFLMPALLLRLVGRLGTLPSLALGGVGTVAIVGGVGALAGIVGVPFSPWVLAVLLVTALGVGLVLRKRTGTREGTRATLILLGALAASASVIAVVGGAVFADERLALNYDSVFHLNAVAYILETGNASSFTLYQVINPGDDVEYYPAAWHGIVTLVVQLTGSPIPLATNVTWFATSALVWLPGVAWLAATIAPRRGTAAAVVAVLLGSLFAAAPYGLLSWGTLYPTGLAHALIPAGLALLVRAVDPVGRLISRRRLVAASALLVWVVAETFAHPRSLLTFAVVAVVILVTVAVRLLARLARRDGGRRLVALVVVGGVLVVLVVGAVAAWVVLRYFGAFDRPISDRLNGGPARASQFLPEAVFQVLAQAPVVAPFDTAVFPAFGLAALVIIGFVVAARRRELLWLPIAFAVIGVFYVAASSSDSDLAKMLSGLWYKDKYRLITALPILAIPAAALGTMALLDAIARTRRQSVRLALMIVSGVLVVVTTLPGLMVARDAVTAMFTVPAAKGGSALLDDAEYKLLARLPELVPAGEAVVGNPWNGSALTWSIGGREALFPHLNGAWGADRDLVASRLDLVASAPEVCAALDRLDVHYLFASDGMLNGGNETVAYWAAVDRAASSPGFTEVAREGGSALYRISACD